MSTPKPTRKGLPRTVLGSVVGGLVLGLGIALLLVQFGRIALGTAAPWVVVAIAIVVRVTLGLISADRGPVDTN